VSILSRFINRIHLVRRDTCFRSKSSAINCAYISVNTRNAARVLDMRELRIHDCRSSNDAICGEKRQREREREREGPPRTSHDASLRGSIHSGEIGRTNNEDNFKEKERNPFSYGG